MLMLEAADSHLLSRAMCASRRNPYLGTGLARYRIRMEKNMKTKRPAAPKSICPWDGNPDDFKEFCMLLLAENKASGKPSMDADEFFAEYARSKRKRRH